MPYYPNKILKCIQFKHLTNCIDLIKRSHLKKYCHTLRVCRDKVQEEVRTYFYCTIPTFKNYKVLLIYKLT